MKKYSQDDHKKRIKFLEEITKDYTSAIRPSNEDCDAYLDMLKSAMTSEHFFWVVNLSEQRVERTAGVSKALGYSDNLSKEDNNLSLYDIYKIVHKDMQASTKAKREKAALYINQKLKGSIKPLSEDFIYSVLVCFTAKDGRPLLVKQKSTAFQVDKDGNMISYLSWHTIIKDYNSEGPSLEIVIGGKREYQLERKIIRESSELITSPFTPRQREILTTLADYAEKFGIEESVPDYEIISELLKNKKIYNTPNTIKSQLSRVKIRSIDYYDREFKRPIDLAIYLRKYHLI